MSFRLYYNKCRENKTENGLGFSSSSLVSYLKDYSKFSSPNSTPFVGYSSKFLMSWPISSIIYGCYRQCDGWLIRNASHDLWVYIYIVGGNDMKMMTIDENVNKKRCFYGYLLQVK
jgi:hypothetical protein